MVRQSAISMSAWVVVLAGVPASALATPIMQSYGPAILGTILAQSSDPQPPVLPKPPTIPSDAAKAMQEAQEKIDAAAIQTMHLLDVLHQKGETKLRIRESGGVDLIYGEDGEPISMTEADERAKESKKRSSYRKENGRLGFSISLFLFISYLILRGSSRMAGQ